MRAVRTIRRNQRGSALLIVFLFAAILAISLYMEMPVIAFEAKRAKEQLLVDRGKEYAHAVKLYYRKFRSYPPSLDALENTNRMRFLRHRFKDPMTGDTNWRLLHAGPGGQLTDSKVNPIGLAPNGQNSGTANANNGNSSSTASSFASNSQNTTGLNPQSPAPSGDNIQTANAGGLPQRPPEMPVNGGPALSAANNADPTQSLMPPLTTEGQPSQSETGQVQAAQPGTVAISQQPGSLASAGQATQQAPGIASQANPAVPMQGVQGLMTNPNPLNAPGSQVSSAPQTTLNGAGTAQSNSAGAFNTSTTTSSSGMGVMQTGGLAGVASLAKGVTIKLVNDQSDYSLWEFYYDPTKDTSAVGGQSGINPLAGVQQSNSPGVNTASPNSIAPGMSTVPGPSTTTSPNPTVQPAPSPIPQQSSPTQQP